jgi:hypothetical protein
LFEYSIPTALIAVQQWTRRLGNEGGSEACAGKDGRSGTIRSKPFVRVSHIRSKVCFLEDEIQRGMMMTRSHTMVQVASRLSAEVSPCGLGIKPSRRASSEEVNGIESRPTCDTSLHSVNTGSPKLVVLVNHRLYGDGTPILPNGLPVMGVAAGVSHRIGDGYKSAAMPTKVQSPRGSGVVHVSIQKHERRTASAV